MSSETRNAFRFERSSKVSQRPLQTQDSSHQNQPMSKSPAEPANDAAEPVAWLSLVFPAAAAREEQIRHAAQAGDMVNTSPHLRSGDGPDQAHAGRDPTGQTRSDLSRQSVTVEDGKRHDGFGRNTDIIAQRMQIAAATAGTNKSHPFSDREGPRNEPAAHEPGDAAFRETVGGQSPFAAEEWVSSGRTVDMFAPLMEAADAGHWQEFEALLTEQFAFIASTTPTAQAVEDHKRLLLTNGPQKAVFQTAVTWAAGLFLVERPRRGAEEIEKALQGEGPVAAAAKLRRLTDHEAADPLSAGQLLSLSEKSIDAIASHFCAVLSSERIRPTGHSSAGIASTSYAQQSQIFSNLSATADSASRSEQGLRATKRLAYLLRDAPIDTFVTASISNGDGVILPLEIARLRAQNGPAQGTDELALLIQIGVQELRESTRGAVLNLDATASLIMELMTRRDARTNTAQGGMTEKWRQAYPDIAEDLDTHLAVLNRYGYAFARTIRSLEESGPWLDRVANNEALRSLGTVPEEEDFSELLFALEAMPSSVAEMLRQGNADLLEAGAAGDPYLRLRELAIALQWFEAFRQNPGAVSRESGDHRPPQP